MRKETTTVDPLALNNYIKLERYHSSEQSCEGDRQGVGTTLENNQRSNKVCLYYIKNK